jgi:threonine dehydrogenase-like Zn-dependent dehydrogenase
MDMIMRNITLTGGVNPARHYIDGILPDVLEGRIEPGRVFDRTVGLDGVPGGPERDDITLETYSRPIPEA